MLNSKKTRMKLLSIFLAANVILSNGTILAVNAESVQQSQIGYAATKTITSLAPTQGPNITVNQGGGCGFTFPTFNAGAATFDEVKDDLSLFVKQDGEWVSIDNNAESGWVYDKNFGNFWDGPGGYWFNNILETTYVKIASKTNPNVAIEYTLYVAPLNTQLITAMAPTQGPDIQVSPAGGCGFTFPTFNGGGATFKDVKEDLALFVKQGEEWVSIDGNADSGWIYDRNFGHFWDGPGGFWFNPVEETTFVKVASKSNPNVYIQYKLIVNEPPVRNSYKITNFDGRSTFEADKVGALGLPLPKIDGGIAYKKEVDNFVYEVKVNGEWVNILQSDITGFKYSANGYDKMSDKNQWGYWTDYIFGLWFQPIQEDVEFRVGYPLNGQKGGAIGDNYVTYKFIGNPNAPRPDVSNLGSIEIGTTDNPVIDGWELSWSDEFNGTELDRTKWSYETGYYLNNDPKDWGWGNNELQHYTDSTDNVFVQDGKLNIVALEDPKTFPEIDPNRVAPYSSGKITTKDKYKFTYGRIDFSAKLPIGQGAWPALWMMPNDNVYGTWAASGEIDVMEARGRVPGESSGAIHFGGQWPGNTHVSGVQTFPDGGRIDQFHTYSVVWEADSIKWYVDGRCFYSVSKEEWYTTGVANNPYAPFDQDFYIIMNLAMGGWFDGGVQPTPDMFPSTMQVDYVRVYNGEEKVNVPVSGVELDKNSAKLTSVGETTKLTATVLPADATNKAVTWKSSNPAVATVTSSGTVKALANGTTTITATTADGNKTVDCTVTVDIIPIPVQSISLDKTDVKIGSIGGKVTLTPTIMPVSATNKGITWTTSNPEVATVDSNGVVTSVKNGVAIITATTADGGKTATAKVTVDVINIDVAGDCGVFDIKSDSIKIFYKNAVFAILSYKINGAGQQNVIMDINNNNAIYTINNLKANDKVDYYFTYRLAEGPEQLSQNYTYVHNTDGLPPVEPPTATDPALVNGNFDDGLNGWLGWSWVDGDNFISKVKVEDGKAIVSVPELKGGLETWAIQFRQRGTEFKLTKDVEYKLSFEISSTIDRDAEIVIQNYGYRRVLSQKISLKPETTKFEYTFKALADELVELNFLLGKYGEYNAHNVTIDNVVLQTKANADNKEVAKNVVTMIAELPAEITLADKVAVQAVREAYEALTQAQKTYVTNLDKLVAAENKIDALEADKVAAQNVTDKINALPTVITLADKQAVISARAAFNSLSDAQKTLVPVTAVTKLVAAESIITELEANKPVVPAPGLVNGNFDDGLNGWLAWSWIDGDSFISKVKVENGKAIVPVPELKGGETWAVQFRQRGPEFKLDKDVEYKLSFEISSTIARDAEIVIQNYGYARTFANKIAIGPETKKFEYTFKATASELVELNFLLGKYAEYSAHNVTIDNVVLMTKADADKNEATKVDTLIKALPTTVALTDKAVVEAARAAYNELTDAQKAYVTSLDKLVAAEGKIAELEEVANVEAANKAAAEVVVGKINELPEDVALTYKAAVEAARVAYNSLTEAQRAYVTNLNKLAAAESKIAELEAQTGVEDGNKVAAQVVVGKINLLPATVALTDKSTVEAARTAYNALTEAQKAYVTNLERLVAAESKIAELEAQTGVEDGNKAVAQVVVGKINELPTNVTLTDKSTVEAARAAYNALTEAQKAYVTNLERLVAAEIKIKDLEKEPDVDVTPEIPNKPVVDKIENPNGENKVVVEANNGSISVEITDIKGMKNPNGSLKIESNEKIVVLPFAAVDPSLLSEKSKVVVNIVEVKNEQLTNGLKAVKKVFEFKLSVITGDKTVDIHNFNNKLVTVTLTLTDEELNGLDKSNLAVFYFNESTKKYEEMETTINGNDVTFKTPHFSKFIVAEKSTIAEGDKVEIKPDVPSTKPEEDKKEELPNTGGMPATIMLIGALVLIGSGIKLRSRRRV